MSDDLLEMKANVLKALGQPTRLKILELLRDGERCACEIFPAIQEERSNVSRHLALMKAAGILVSRKQGQMVHYRV
jgi:DNA-binding transcriptional ArsR family regulator